MFRILRNVAGLLFLAALLIPLNPGLAQEAQPPAHAHPALAVGAALDAGGRLWLVEVRDGHLQVHHATEEGHGFSAPVRVLPTAEVVTTDGENRPKIAVGADGVVHLSWTQNLGARMTGFIRYARSTDGGRSFTPAITLNSDRQMLSHRFDAMTIDGQGGVAVAWLDARERDGKSGKGSPLTQVGLYAARSSDGGASFAPDRLVASHTCQCCRVALAWSKAGPLALWRHVYDKNVRDCALADLAGGAPLRATDDGWEIDGCPHHGGAIAVDGRGDAHIVWFSNGAKHKGIFHQRLRPSFAAARLERVTALSEPLALGNAAHQAGHPAVVAAGQRVLLAWREFDGARHAVWAMLSTDAGVHWAAPQRLADTADGADYALPLIDDKQALVVWNTAAEGVRVLPVGEGQ